MKSAKQQKASLQRKNDKVIIIIDPKEKEPLNAQKEYLKDIRDCIVNCNTLGYFKASIIHDRDIKEDGELKTIHLHAFLQDHEKHTLREWLDLIEETTGASEDQISIDETNSEILQVQYLRHDRKENKAKYEADEIATNDREELGRRLNEEYVKPVDPIQEALMSCKTLTEFMDMTDYLTANRLRGLFKDLHTERTQQIAYAELERNYHALQVFARELMETLNLTLKDNSCRLDNWRYWSDRADKLDLY